MKKKTLMITGASGFIGSNFIKKYSEDYNIIPICLIENRPEDLDYSGVDCILHLAALVHQMKGAPEERYFQVNTELTRRLATEAKKNGVKHFVFYSTVAVWGTHGYFDHTKVITLDTPVNPKDAYGKSKYEAEKLLENLQNESFKVCILRPPMVYGNGCPGNMQRLEKLVKFCPILPFGNDENKRSIVHVDRLLEITKEVIDMDIIGIKIPRDNRDNSIKNILDYLIKEKKIILIKLPRMVIKILFILNSRIIESIYGSLTFRERK